MRLSRPLSEGSGWYDASGTYVASMNPSMGPGSPEGASVDAPGAAISTAGRIEKMGLFDPRAWAGTPLGDNYLEHQALEQFLPTQSEMAPGGAYAFRDQSKGGAVAGYAQQVAANRYAYFDPAGKLIGYRDDMAGGSVYTSPTGEITTYAQPFEGGTQWLDPQGNVVRIDLSAPRGGAVGDARGNFGAVVDERLTSAVKEVTVRRNDHLETIMVPAYDATDRPRVPRAVSDATSLMSNPSQNDVTAEQAMAAAAAVAQEWVDAQAESAQRAAREREGLLRAGAMGRPPDASVYADVPHADFTGLGTAAQAQLAASAVAYASGYVGGLPLGPSAPPESVASSPAYYGYGGAYQGPEPQRQATLRDLATARSSQEDLRLIQALVAMAPVDASGRDARPGRPSEPADEASLGLWESLIKPQLEAGKGVSPPPDNWKDEIRQKYAVMSAGDKAKFAAEEWPHSRGSYVARPIPEGWDPVEARISRYELDEAMNEGVAQGYMMADVAGSLWTPTRKMAGKIAFKAEGELTARGFYGGGSATEGADGLQWGTKTFEEGGEARSTLAPEASDVREVPHGSGSGSTSNTPSNGGPAVKQIYPNACGPACIEMVLRDASPESMVTQLDVIDEAGGLYNPNGGIKPKDMPTVLNSLDERASVAWRVDAVDISKIEVKEEAARAIDMLSKTGSWIASTGGHYMVVDGIDLLGNVMLRDPALGASTTMSISKFVEWWTGFYVAAM